MPRTAICLTAILTLGGGLAPTVPAQSLSTDLASQIAAAGHLRITTATVSAELYKAHVTGGGDSLSYERSFTIDRHTGLIRDLPAPLSVSEVTRIEFKQGNHAGTGALIGGGIGLAYGVAEMAGLGDAGELAFAYVITTAGGALLGALIGTAIPGWRTVYSVEPGPGR